jgi:hypothetical protein
LAEDTWDDDANAMVTHWLETDHQQSVREVLDLNGTVVNTIGYDAYGQPDLPHSFMHLAEDPMTPDYEPVEVTLTDVAPSQKLIEFDDGDPNHQFELDDLLVLIREDEQITAVEGQDEWTVTLPDDAILFENTVEHFGPMPGGVNGKPVTIVGAGSFTITTNSEGEPGNFAENLQGGGFVRKRGT